MSLIDDRLLSLGIKLELPKPPVANYLGTKCIVNLLYVSGRVSELSGVVGADVTETEAKKAARDTVILILAIVKDIIELDRISEVIKLQGFIRSTLTLTRLPYVLDGASELLIELFGENGNHARTATGVHQLPFGATVQLDMILQLKPNTKI